MKRKLLIGLLAPALLCVAAASQTVVVRPLPFTGMPRILPIPRIPLPLTPTRLPSPLVMPEVTLSVPRLLPHADLAVSVLPAVVPAQEGKEGVEAPAPALDRIFDGRELTLPEDDIERDLGLR